MSDIIFTPQQNRRVPIRRNNLLYGEEDFKFDLELGREYVETDMGQTIVLYSVNLSKTNQDSLYGETKDGAVSYNTPIEVPCVYELDEAELKAYEKTKNLGVYQKVGKFKFGVYEQTLVELGVDIKIGDYIGVQVTESHMEYFVVNNDGRNNYDNGHTMYGYKPFYRSCQAIPVDPSEFNG